MKSPQKWSNGMVYRPLRSRRKGRRGHFFFWLAVERDGKPKIISPSGSLDSCGENDNNYRPIFKIREKKQ
jgi:hypothetical protein